MLVLLQSERTVLNKPQIKIQIEKKVVALYWQGLVGTSDRDRQTPDWLLCPYKPYFLLKSSTKQRKFLCSKIIIIIEIYLNSIENRRTI